MPDAQVLLAAVLGMLIATTGIVIGWAAGRQSVKPRFRGYDPDARGEGTVEVRTSHPESLAVAADLAEEPAPERVVAHRSMSAMSVDQRLESKTVRITIGPEHSVRPWWHGGRHRSPDSRCRVPKFLGSPQATAEFPEVSGEYPVLDGAR